MGDELWPAASRLLLRTTIEVLDSHYRPTAHLDETDDLFAAEPSLPMPLPHELLPAVRAPQRGPHFDDAYSPQWIETDRPPRAGAGPVYHLCEVPVPAWPPVAQDQINDQVASKRGIFMDTPKNRAEASAAQRIVERRAVAGHQIDGLRQPEPTQILHQPRYPETGEPPTGFRQHSRRAIDAKEPSPWPGEGREERPVPHPRSAALRKRMSCRAQARRNAAQIGGNRASPVTAS